MPKLRRIAILAVGAAVLLSGVAGVGAGHAGPGDEAGGAGAGGGPPGDTGGPGAGDAGPGNDTGGAGAGSAGPGNGTRTPGAGDGGPGEDVGSADAGSVGPGDGGADAAPGHGSSDPDPPVRGPQVDANASVAEVAARTYRGGFDLGGAGDLRVDGGTDSTLTTDASLETTLTNSSRVDWRNTLSAESYDVNPTFDDQGRLYVATNGNDPHLQRVDHDTGTVLWDFSPSVASYVVHGPAVHDDTVYMTTSTFEQVPGDANLFAVWTNGTERWHVNLTKGHGAVNLWRGPHTDDRGNVYFVMGRANTSFSEPTQRWLVSYAPNGTLRWKTALWTGRLRPRFVDIADGQVYLSGKNAAAVYTNNGTIRLNESTPYGNLVSTPRDRDDDRVFYEADYHNNTVFAIYTANFTTKWSRDVSNYTNGSAWTVPVSGNGDNVYWFANPSPKDNPGDELATDMVVLDEDDGSVKRTVNLTMDGPAKTRPVVRRDERIYVLTNDNELIAANATAQLWEVDAPESSGQYQAGFTPAAVGPHGHVYFGYTPDFGGQTELVALKADPVLLNERVAFQTKGIRGNTGELASMNASGDVRVYDTGDDQIKQVGPVFSFVDGDDRIEVPYVNNNNELVLVDKSGQTEVIKRNVDAQRLGIGDLDGDGSSAVIYINNSDIYKKEGGEPAKRIADGGNDVRAVTGSTDFNNDGTRDVVFVNKDGEVLYTQGGTATDTGAVTDANEGISVPTDFDGDGETEVAVYDKADKGFDLVDENGFDASFDPTYAVAQDAMAALDADGDGVPDVVYVDKDNKIRYYNVLNDSTGLLNQTQEADKATGVT